MNRPIIQFACALALASLAGCAPAAVVTAAAQRTIAPGQTVTERLTASDPVLDDESHYHVWRIDARPGDRLIVTMRSADMDAFLAWGPLRDGVVDAVDFDDDSGGGTDARLRITMPASGSHGIRANTLMGGELGAYTLTVEYAAPAPPPVAVRVGQTVSGTLNDDSAIHDDGSFYDLYLITGTPGQRVAIEMRSHEVDAYLFGGRLVDGVFNTLDQDDDGASGTDARLEVTLDADGRYAVMANTLSVGETGRYTLSVQRLN